MAITTVNDDGGDDPIREDQPEAAASEQEQQLQETLDALESESLAVDEPAIEFTEPKDDKSPVAQINALDNLDQTLSRLPEEFPFEEPAVESAKTIPKPAARPHSARQKRSLDAPDTLADFMAGGGEIPPDVMRGEGGGEEAALNAFTGSDDRFKSRVVDILNDHSRRIDELTSRIENGRL